MCSRNTMELVVSKTGRGAAEKPGLACISLGIHHTHGM
jgi:hypothetical protein